MILKQRDMVVLHDDNINNIHYKLGLNIYIGSYIIALLISGTKKHYSSVKSIHVVEYFGKYIMNDDNMAILESWLVTFLISFFGNLWKRNARWILLSSLMYPRLPIYIARNVQ